MSRRDTDHARTEGGIYLPNPAEIVLFGSLKIDTDRAFLALVLGGLLLPVIMSPELAAYRDWASWMLWIFPAIYVGLGYNKRG